MNSITRFYVVGGRQKKYAYLQAECHQWASAMIVQVDIERGTVDPCVEYATPPEACAAADHPSILFKAGTLIDHVLHVCTQTEVLSYRLPSFRQLSYLSLPFFNDVHHVCPTDQGTLLIAVTGLDMVAEVSPSGEVLREWDVLGDRTWTRFSQDIDYRKVVTTQPHLSHPNYVFQTGEDIWATRFHQKDAICLTRPGQRIAIGVERPHDGIVFNTSVFFTTVDGQIVEADLQTGDIIRTVDLNAIHDTRQALGWCRGLFVLDEDHIVVGFSRIRPTKIMSNLHWIGHRFGLTQMKGSLPTRIALYDLCSLELCWEQNLEGLEMNAVFSIHQA